MSFIVKKIPTLSTYMIFFEGIYDFVRYVIFYIFKWVRVLVKKDVLVNFLTDSLNRRSILRLADVTAYE